MSAVEPGAAPAGSTVIGREGLLVALDRFLAPDGAARCLVLTGEAGIGKSVLWEAGVEVARGRGFRVLRARSTQAEATLSYACLTDLLDGIEPSELAGLPAPQRSAVEVALHRVESAGLPPETLAISAGLLNALRMLAARDPLLVAIDEVAAVDPRSADALTYAARRLHQSRVRFLLSRRAGRPGDLERAFETGTAEQVVVGPLSFGAVNHLLKDRLGRSFPRRVLRRIYDTSRGNPLIALEVGRMLAERGIPEIGGDLPLPDLADDLFGTRAAGLPEPVRRVLLAVALSARLTLPELLAVTDPLAVEDAREGALLTVEGTRVAQSHPLLAAAAIRQSGARERRDLHRDLAAAAADPVQRARHLALATTGVDPELAGTVAAAASIASERGAVLEAVELAAQALRLTPPHDAEHSDRVLALAQCLYTAGDHPRARELLSAHVDTLPPGPSRAAAHLLLGELAVGDAEYEHIDRAIAESAGDPGLRARALARGAMLLALHRVERLDAAEAQAEEALVEARLAGADTERRVLVTLAWIRVLRGRPIDDLVREAPTTPVATSLYESSLERPVAARLAFRGEIAAARASLARQLSVADLRGEARSGVVLQLNLCELALREGDVPEAARLLDEWDHWTAFEEEEVRIPRARLQALLSAVRGEPERARVLAAEVLDANEAWLGSKWDRLDATRASGMAALFDGDTARALTSLQTVWRHALREGVDDPGVFPVAAELVEALVEAGDLEGARQVAEALRLRATEQQHPWGLATAQRCDAVVELAGRYVEPAAAALAGAIAAYARLGLRFDRARALLFLGRVQRRFKKRADARLSLTASQEVFEQIGCDGWAEQARSELARVSGRRSAARGELTASERQVAELAAAGLSNKQIAAQLFVTVYTVEAHLSHAYAKLGVGSRGQLAGRLGDSPRPHG